MSTDAVLERLTLLHPKVIDLSLGRVRRLLTRLGQPEQSLPPVVHVAGTNGKGSLIAHLRAMLESAGYGVQAYTSPHLVRFSERIRLTDGLIEEDYLTDLLEECERNSKDDPVTFFEITTAAAFLAFSRNPADVLLLETGLGGRLDATNVIDHPRLCAISPVSIDHTGFLGDTLAKIAAEKAGILKAGAPVVLGPQRKAAFDAIAAKAAEVGSPLVPHARPQENADWWWFETSETGLSVHVGDWSAALPPPALPGVHQTENASLAVACLRRLDGFDVGESDMARGLTKAVWPARLQQLTDGPVVGLLPDDAELWLDGGHNAAAGAALAKTIEAWSRADREARPLYVVLGMMRTKDPQEFFARLAPLTTGSYAIPIPGETNSIEPVSIAEALSETDTHATSYDDVESALRAIKRDAGPASRPRVLICGSIYLAGHVLKQNGTPVT